MIENPTLIPGLRQVDADVSQLLEYTRWEKRWCGDPNRRKEEGRFWRCIENQQTRERCLQVILFYQVQRFPYHPHDFAPIYFYYNSSGQMTRILYDYYHHQVASLAVSPQAETRVIVYAPWHAFKTNETHWAQRPFHCSDFLLANERLREWWAYTDMRQFKLRSKFINPWHPGLFPESAAEKATFRDEAACPVCGEIFYLDLMDFDGERYSLEITCSKRHAYTAVYHPGGQNVETRPHR